MIRLIAYRELRSLYANATAWILLTITSAIMAWLFFSRLEIYQKIQPSLSAANAKLGVTDLVISPTISSAILIYMILIPLLGMASLSDERRSGRIALWYSSPVSTAQILFGKYLGILLGSAPFLLLPFIISSSLLLATSIDPGKLAGITLAMLLAGLSISAVTLWTSSLSRHPLIVPVMASGLLLFLWLITPGEDASGLFNWLAMQPRISHLLLGLVSSQDIGYFLILTTGPLALTWHSLWKDTHSTGRHWWRHGVFYLLVILVLAEVGYLTNRHAFSLDITSDHRNSLSQSSINLLSALQEPIKITAFAPSLPVAQSRISDLIERYQRVKPNISLTFVDPAIHPDQARQHGIRKTGELLIEFQGKSGKALLATETDISSTIARLALRGERWVTAISGHGEASLNKTGQQSLGLFANRLQQAGYRSIEVSLTENAAIPRNTAVLLIAGPQRAFSPAETAKIKAYLDQGGNLLWMMESREPRGLADLLGIQTLPGIIVDLAATDLGLKSPTAAVATRYPNHPALAGLDQGSIFVGATGLRMATDPAGEWRTETLLSSSPRSWNETGELEGSLKIDSRDEVRGPLSIGLVLSRTRKDDSSQHIVVISDVDFISNAAIGHGANASLGLGLIHWLTGNNQMVSARAVPAPDIHLDWSTTTAAIASLFLMIGLPLLLAIAGLVIRLRRRRR